MLKIHHLGHSQSERIVWLCEELGLSYDLQHHARDAVTRLSPPALKALHPLGAAPVIEDGELLMAESAAIVEYIVVKHGGTLTFESEVGKGTTFFIRLPLSEGVHGSIEPHTLR